jgi:hypothetical protein
MQIGINFLARRALLAWTIRIRSSYGLPGGQKYAVTTAAKRDTHDTRAQLELRPSFAPRLRDGERPARPSYSYLPLSADGPANGQALGG